MLQPARTKYRKMHRGRGQFAGKATRCATLAFGSYGLKSQEAGEISSRQLEAARRAMTHEVARGGKIWIRIFPSRPVTKRAAETRMGSGKGSVDHWVAPVRPGRIVLEIAGVREDQAREAFRLAAAKLPMRTQFIAREEHGA